MVLTEAIKNYLKTQSINTLKDKISHGAVGTDDATPQSSDTALGNEVFRNSIFESELSGDTLTTSVKFGSSDANGYEIVEAGFFDGSSSGVMAFRDLFNKTLKTDDVELVITASFTPSVVEL